MKTNLITADGFVPFNHSVRLSINDMIKQNKGTPYTHLVYLGLYNFRDIVKNECYPSYLKIGESISISKSTVAREIKNLIDNGIVICIQEKVLGSARIKNRYFFPLDYDLFDSEDTKKLAKLVSKYDYETWNNYFNTFIKPLREEKIKQETKITKQSESNNELPPEIEAMIKF